MVVTPLDREIFSRIMAETPKKVSSLRDIGKQVLQVGFSFLGTPYGFRTLDGEDKEELVINFRQMDCFTFVENTVVLTRMIREGKETLAALLEQLRYHQGQRVDFASRLHYFSHWLYEGVEKGWFINITPSLGGEPIQKKLFYITAHLRDYPALFDDRIYKKMKEREEALDPIPLYHLPKGKIKAVQEQIRDGDIVAITTACEGLDVSHVGFAVQDGKGLRLLHASSEAGMVILAQERLTRYLEQDQSRLGIVVARLV